jgi:signal transduction histidine kinase
LSSNVEDQLAKLGRYEALFELTDAINASSDIDATSQVLAGRLKYVTDIFAWRYLSLDAEGTGPGETEPTSIIIYGFRGRAPVSEAGEEAISAQERELWKERRARVLCEGADAPELAHLPDYFRRADVLQTYSLPLTASAEQRALLLFCKRRQPFNELDLKFAKVVGNFFHRRVQMLWEQRKLRELEVAYLQQEVTLRQSEKLATLGRMSAGMAHELNNPASAALRSAQQLRDELAHVETARFALGQTALSDEQLELFRDLEKLARERAARPEELDALSRSDLEEELEDWLDQHGIDEPWEHAATLAGMGKTTEDLEVLLQSFDNALLGIVVHTLCGHFNAHRLLAEMGHGVGRISEIVRALKSYTYMDQAPVQRIDVRKGLDDTVVMLHNKLKDGVDVERDYAEDVPDIEAFGSELNQVWTNIVDNALGAMEGKGLIRMEVSFEDPRVIVRITDSGPGIPADVIESVFDPFFTTKAPGEGTGLGLNISHNIITQKHGGEISVESQPGRTTFTAKLPLTLEGVNRLDETEEAGSSEDEARRDEEE